GELTDVDEPGNLETCSPKLIKAKDDDLSSEDESVEEDKENNSENIENDCALDNDNELDHISESSCMHENENDLVYNFFSKGTDHYNKFDDSFRIYKILKRNNDKVASKSSDAHFPPGYTPDVVEENAMNVNSEWASQPKDDMVDNNKGVSTSTSGYNGVLKLKSGGSLLDVTDELIKVGVGHKQK
nr:hypothetical protein [Tanacetum cinerariifolium]